MPVWMGSLATEAEEPSPSLVTWEDWRPAPVGQNPPRALETLEGHRPRLQLLLLVWGHL